MGKPSAGSGDSGVGLASDVDVVESSSGASSGVGSASGVGVGVGSGSPRLGFVLGTGDNRGRLCGLALALALGGDFEGVRSHQPVDLHELPERSCKPSSVENPIYDGFAANAVFST